jgi:hypothetical protein
MEEADVGDVERGSNSRGSRNGDIPKRLRLRPGVAFVPSALFMMDAVVLVDSAMLQADAETSHFG